MSETSDFPPDPAEGRGPRPPLRRMILRNTAALPAIVTLLNGIAGFASIHYATKGLLGSPKLGSLTASAWLIFAAMFFDALDGRVARMTRQASDFGAQLDSLCDAISFGVAPAILMIHTFHMILGDFHVPEPLAADLGKAVMAVGALYACCAVLRLARFNIENAPDVLSHMYFKGLPSPGAAAAVAAMVLLYSYLQGQVEGWKSAGWLNVTVAAALPAATLAAALLMISTFRYPHLINRYVLGRRPFNYIVKLLLIIVAGIILREIGLALAILTFVLSGPVGALWRKFRPAGPEEEDAEEMSVESE